jgi:Lon protease-like protein
MAARGELIPIFPLASVVLFPKVQTPLHLFEPRYRQMAADALAGERRIGMVVVRPDEVGAMAGDPAVFGVGCAGSITAATELSDGRYDIVLLGTHRFRIVEEPARPADRLYRVARVLPLEDTFEERDATRVAALRERLTALVWGGGAGQGAPPALRDADDSTFVNALANLLAFPASEKQSLLEADGIPARYQRLADLLEFVRAGGEAAECPKSPTLH